MPDEEIIDSFLDRASLRDDKEFFLNSVKEMLDSFNGLKAVKLDGLFKTKDVVDGVKETGAALDDLTKKVTTVKTADEQLVKASRDVIAATTDLATSSKVLTGQQDLLIKQTVQNRLALDGFKKARKDLNTELNNGTITTEQFTKALEGVTKQEIALRTENLELSRATRNMAKEAQSATGSLNEMRAQLALSLQTFDLLSEADKKTDIGANLQKNIDDLTASISKQEQGTGRFQRNVGNYSGALGVLEQALKSVNQKLDDNLKANTLDEKAVEELKKEQGLLVTLLGRQEKGFAQATGEIRENQKAILQLTQIYGEDSKIVQELTGKTAVLQDTVGDLRATIKAQASDTKVFDGLIGAAQGLVGVYGIAQGAQALFGVESEQLQKTLVKLQAVTTILNGLQGIQALLQKESAARQLITIGLQRLSIIQINIQNATESKSIVIRYLAIAAQKALNLAMSAAGGPLIALIGGLTLLVVLFSSFSTAATEAAASLTDLNDQLEINSKLNTDAIDAIGQASDKIVGQLESNFATEKQIREKRMQFLEQQLERQQAFNDKERSKFDQADEYIRNTIATKKSLNDDEKKLLDAAISIRDNYNEQTGIQYELERKIELQKLRNQRSTKEESIKAQQDEIDILKTRLTTRSSLQNDIASDEKAGFDDRIKAMREFGRLQQQIIANDASKALKDPTLTPTAIKKIEADRAAAMVGSRRDTDKKIEDLTQRFYDRQQKAQFDIAAASIQTEADRAQKIADSETESLDDRLFAAYTFSKAQEALVNGQKNLDLSNATLTGKERQAIEAKADAAILKLRADFVEKSNAITLAAVDLESRTRVAGNNQQRDEALLALNERFNAGKISLAKYNRDRLALEKGYAVESIQIEIDNAKKILEVNKSLGLNTFDEAARLAELEKQLSDEITNAKIRDLERLRAKQEEIRNAVIDLAKTAITAQYDNEKNKIQDQINLIDVRTAREVEAVNKSVASEEEKANKIAILNNTAQAQKEALAKRQRDLDYQRAKVERAFAIGRIIADTGAAVVAALGAKPWTPANVAFAKSVATLGGLQLAAVLATPLPKFRTGKDRFNRYEGAAIVGDGGKSELHVREDGSMFKTPNTPTVTYVGKRDVILPDADKAINDMINGSFRPMAKSASIAANNEDLIRAFKKGNKQLSDAIKGKPVLKVNGTYAGVVAIQQHLNDNLTYIDQQINF